MSIEERRGSELAGPLLQSIQQGHFNYTYRGIPTVKNPFDWAIYPMLLWEARPRSIVEIGSNRGGSALWLADTMRAFGMAAEVHSVDRNPVTGLAAPGVTFHHGDARRLDDHLSPEFMRGLPRPLLVIDDSDHQKDTVLAVLHFFHQWLAPGEYIIIEDGIVTELGVADAFDGGPQAAVAAFMAQHPDEYEIDARYCDFYGRNVTYAVNGYLRRLPASQQRRAAPPVYRAAAAPEIQLPQASNGAQRQKDGAAAARSISMTGSLIYHFSADHVQMRIGVGTRTNGAIRIAETDVGIALYGQYVPLPPGRYTAKLYFYNDRPCRGVATMDVSAELGQRLLGAKAICADQIIEDGMTSVIEFSSSAPLGHVEVRLGSQGGFVGDIESLEISGELGDVASRIELADLPEVPIENTISRGRNLYDGYRRGVALQFADLPQRILSDPDYNSARQMAGTRTILGDLNLCNFFLILKFYLPKLPPGAIIEFGSYMGGGAIFLAGLAQKFLPGRKVVAFDTFAGMPPTDQRVDRHQAGAFGGVDLAELRRYVDEIGLDNLEFIQGNFADTAAAELQKAGSICFAHVDCDIRSSIACAYDAAKPHMVPGGYWILDDPMVADCLGAAEAMEDLLIRRDGLNSEQVFPHYVFRQP
jgi:cephalosporin hydroxylase